MNARMGLMVAALWWGSLTALGFVVVPMLFTHLGSPAAAGVMAAKLFTAQTWLSIGCTMLLQKNATVTICHSATKNLKAMTLQADVIVVAVGKQNMLTADMVKPGAVVIDVGMNRNADGKLCGDVDFDRVKEVAGYITPVPGGVGPMTITMLLVNTLEAAERS